MSEQSCTWSSIGCRSLDIDGLTVVLGCANGSGCGLAVECAERALDQLLAAARLSETHLTDCIWSSTWVRDWRVARQAVSCSGQSGCRQSADCVTQAQALLQQSAQRMVTAILGQA